MARPEDMLFELFRDAANAFNVAKDYSGASAEDIVLAPAAGEVWEVARMLVQLQAAAALVPAGWGSGAALTNGICIEVRDGSDTVLLDLTDGHTIKTNGDWGGMCYDVDGLGGANPTIDTYLHARWSFWKAGAPITLQGKLGHKIVLVADDDWTAGAAVSHLHFMIQGIKKISNVP